ncbi:MAG TPA: hypothetical protein VG452_10875 [Egibacteraceae bacterium]|nr:hypothetical protein [Actinomycetota bacterium]HWB72710.1 hypothetical protein [Egibacteraceae bacterium]
MQLLQLKPWHVPLRVASGAFILQSGLSKRGMEGEAAEGLHGFAAAGHPEVEQVEPETFAKGLSTTEIVLGAALLVPAVPSWLAAAGLTAFAAGLNRLYFKAPGLRQEGDIRPTEEGMGIAKDVWMTAMGVAMLIDAVSDLRNGRP